MPWVRIPPENLPLLPTFGIDLVLDDGAYAWYRSARGRMYVEKADPRIFVEDIEDAIQLGATAIIVSGTPAD